MIDVETLKKKVISLAIQGKLTEQLPSDGEAGALYAEIQKEKKRLIKEGRLKKEKKYAEITNDEIPFNIPNNWNWYRLGDVCNVLMGQSPDGMNVGVDKEGMEFHQGKIFFGDKFLKPSDQKTTECTRVAEANSVLLCVRAPIGVANITERQICIGRGLCSIGALAGMEPYYLYYYLSICKKDFENKGTGSTFSAITVDVVKNKLIPLPPLNEQKRIADKIDDAFTQLDRIKAYQQLYMANIELLKNKVLDAGIRGKLTEQLSEDGNAEDLYAQIQKEKAKLIKEGRIKKEKSLPEISDDEIPFGIPSNWKWVRLGDVSIFKGGYAFKSDSYVKESQNQVIRLGNVKPEKLLLDAKPVYISDEMAIANNGFLILEDDILVTMTGTRKRKDYFFAVRIDKKDIVGRSLFLNQRVGCIRFISGVRPDYLVKVLQSTAIRDIVLNYETGAVNQGNLGSEEIKRYVYIPLPPLAEQERIVEKIESITTILS